MLSMKKTLSFLLVLLLVSSFVCAETVTTRTDLSGLKIYVDPGHGSYGDNDRPLATIPYPNLEETGRPEIGVGFYESNTNLWKCEALAEKLRAMGATVDLSHTTCGGTEDGTVHNPYLSVRAREAEQGGYDYFISVHSNAGSSSLANYPLLIFRGYTNEPSAGDSKDRAIKLWPYMWEAMDAGIDPGTRSGYSSSVKYVVGDLSFYGEDNATTSSLGYYGHLGVLKHSIPGYLSEGYFHTYQPARHRALNRDYCRMEGIRYYRGIAAYYGLTGAAADSTGYIMGTVKDLNNKMTRSTTLSETSFYYQDGSNDQWVPCNGAVVSLYKAGKKIAEYEVDNNYNGIFVFYGLEPGDDYTLDATCAGYKSLAGKYKAPLTVTANETTCPKIFLEEGEDVDPMVYAYNLDVTHNKSAMTYTFSFDTHTAATSGALVFYHNNEEVGEIALADVAVGANSYTIAASDFPSVIGDVLTWGVRLSGEAIADWAKVYEDDIYTRAFCTVDKSTESDYFGSIYVIDRKGNNTTANTYKSGVYVYSSHWLRQNTSPYMGGQTFWGSPCRPTVGADGTVYFADWGNAHAGVYVADPAQMDGAYTTFFEGTMASSGLVTNNGNAVGGSAACVAVYGTGADTRLLVTNEDAGGDLLANGVNMYQIGQADGTVLDTWSNKPTNVYPITIAATAGVDGNYDIHPDEHGFWLGNKSGKNENTATSPALQFFDWDGTQQFTSVGFDGLLGGGVFAVKDDMLVMNDYEGAGQFILYQIAWSGNTPTLTRKGTYTHNTSGIYRMVFDYAGNLLVSGEAGLQIYVLPTADNTTTVPAKHALTVIKTAPMDSYATYGRAIYATDLDVVDNGNKTYTFSFTANENAIATTLLFYADGELIGTLEQTEQAKVGKNSYTISGYDLPGEPEAVLTWGVELVSKPIEAFAKVFEDTTHVLTRAHAAVDAHITSDYMGRIYVTNHPGMNKDNLYVYNADYTLAEEAIMAGQSVWESLGRPAVDSEGYVWIAEYGDKHSGLYVMNPETLTAASFFDGTQDVNGVWTNSNGVAMGSSSPSCAIYNGGEQTRLFLLNEDASTDENATLVKSSCNVYKIGTSAGNLHTWSSAPSQVITLKDNNKINMGIAATSHGVFTSMNTDSDKAGYRSLMFYDNSGTRQYVSTNSDEITSSIGGGVAVSKDESLLALIGGDSKIVLYDIAWTGDVPTLTHRGTYDCGFAAVGTLGFDYAGNLVATAGTGYDVDQRLVVFALPKADNTCVTHARETQTVVNAHEKFIPVTAIGRAIYAYDLRVVDNGDSSYTFTFKANDNATETELIFYQDGQEVGSFVMPQRDRAVLGENSYRIEKDALPGEAGAILTWAVRLKTHAIEDFATIFEDTEVVLDRLHAVVDASPESDYMGRIYMENHKTGAGSIYAYNADYTMYAADFLAGQEEWVSAGRPAVDAEGTVWLADFGDARSGVYVMDPTTLVATPFFDGTQDTNGVWTNASGVGMGSSSPSCAVWGTGEEAKLFVANEDKYNSDLVAKSYNVYNIGTAAGNVHTWNEAPSQVVTMTDNQYANFAIAATSHGAFICQNKTNADAAGSRSLMFYDNSGVRQYVSTDTDEITSSPGGGVAVSGDESLLAVSGGNNTIVLYDIAWTGDVPMLTHLATYDCGYAALGSLSFDYAGNLVATAGTAYSESMRLIVFALPNTANETITPAQKKRTVRKPGGTVTALEQVWVNDGCLYMPNMDVPTMIQVYSVDGRLVGQMVADEEVTPLHVPMHGVYVVCLTNAHGVKAIRVVL